MSVTDDTDRVHAVASRKAAFHLLPILCLVYFMAFVDRTNVGLAKTSLEADVGISVAAYGTGAGIFFLSYALLEVPSNLIMHRIGPRRWITRIAITWGALCACMMFVQGELSFYLVRFLLGAAEAGLYPALMYIVTVWFSQRQRVSVVGILYLAVCAGLALGGPLGGALMELQGTAGLFGWQWMFLIEGAITIVVGGVVWRWIPDKPADAPWLTAREAEVLNERAVVRTAPAHTELKGNAKIAFGRPFILTLSVIYFANQINSVAIQYNFPSIVERLGVEGSFTIGLVSGSVGIGALVGVLVIPWLHRRASGELHVLTGVTAATVVVAAVYTQVDGALARILLIDLAMMLLIGVLPLYWSVAMARMSGLMAAAGLAFINTVGLLGGFTGPYLYGFAEGRGSETGGHAVLLGAAVLGVLLLPLLRHTVRAEDRKTAAAEPRPGVQVEEAR
ncbi:MFS transporter [Streptomyces sp. TRM66268-LWL]|uniref:MFS transporter n=1 Tax=Streptomyces polyasparticus TaxID=2767826 RepID=A0ABR7SLP6_9ACTN|nr:MFS transporter [Streptomyces polyasparticus]MBC9715829.1 MFS transporter [Streptomyces polyasparticus]